MLLAAALEDVVELLRIELENVVELLVVELEAVDELLEVVLDETGTPDFGRYLIPDEAQLEVLPMAVVGTKVPVWTEPWTLK